MSDLIYDLVKDHMLEHFEKTAHFSFYREDEHHRAIVSLGPVAAPALFQLMIDYPFEACHFAYSIIPILITPPQNIIDRMNIETLSDNPGFSCLDVEKMEDIYKDWGKQIGALPQDI